MTTGQSPDTVELLSFRLGDQEYCLDIMSVREIRGWTGATPLPHAPSHLKGVINLRGTVLPVVDLGVRLGMDPVRGGERNVIVVVQNGAASAGLLVDAVSDILTIPAAALQPPPDMIGNDPTARYVSALTLVEGELVRVLGLGAIVPDEHAQSA